MTYTFDNERPANNHHLRFGCSMFLQAIIPRPSPFKSSPAQAPSISCLVFPFDPALPPTPLDDHGEGPSRDRVGDPFHCIYICWTAISFYRHGPMFIGFSFNLILYGIMITQVYLYFNTFKKWVLSRFCLSVWLTIASVEIVSGWRYL